MSWESLRSTLRTRVQSEQDHVSKRSIIGSMVRLSALAGVMVAALLIPATTFVAVTANNVSQEFLSLPLELRQTPNPQTTRLLASNGDLVAYFYKENRQDVPLKDIAPNMQTALLSIEDNRFYQHGALDLKGTLRALVNNASAGQTQGGSSITQQLVKLTLVQQAKTREQIRAATEKSTSRKIRELKYAISYEKTHTKQEILERYLNIAYFGDGAYGISAASYHYFSVSPKKLSILQAATIAGLVKNPVQFDPNIYPERALQRRNTVIGSMARLGKISQTDAEKLMAKPLGLKITRYPNGCVASVAAFSCDYIRRVLLTEKDLGATIQARQQMLESGGLTIKSNIDIRMQKAANKAVKGHVKATDKAIGALALVEPGTGKVRGLAQSRPMGRDKKKGESFINYTVPKKYGYSGGFQAGSTFKLFTVTAALKKGINVGQTYRSPPSLTVPSGTYYDCQGGATGPWQVKNSTSSGTMNMYTGTRLSVNTYFAQLEKAAGLCNVVKAAEAMGITVRYDPAKGISDQVPSFTLGVVSVSPLDMAAAYATAASGGTYCKPMPINSIVDSNGKTLKKYEPACKKVMSKDEAAQINDILRGVQQPGGFGYSNGTALNIPSAAKTGTTNSNQSVWYVGYTPELATAAMIAGANSKGIPSSLSGTEINGRIISFQLAGGSSLAGPMWKAAMGVIHDYLAPVNFDKPPAGQPVAAKAPAKAPAKKKADKPGGGH
jgi:membrane peptidoglycan carboxypeptidase